MKNHVFAVILLKTRLENLLSNFRKYQLVIGYASARFLCLLGMTKLKYVAEGSPSRERVSPEHPYQLPHSFVALLPNAGGTRGQGGIPLPSTVCSK